jgi:two-component sensor histidine kinase
MGVGEAAATAMALVIHELATNSLKCRALSTDTGTLDVSGFTSDDDLNIVWTERGGPEVEAPKGLEGYGSKLVVQSVSRQLGGSIAYDWSSDGLVVNLKLKAERLAA